MLLLCEWWVMGGGGRRLFAMGTETLVSAGSNKTYSFGREIPAKILPRLEMREFTIQTFQNHAQSLNVRDYVHVIPD